jgi:hypothetical protein
VYKPNEIATWCSVQAKSDTKAINQAAVPSSTSRLAQLPKERCPASGALHLNETVNSAFNKSITAAVRYIVKP